MDFNNLSEELKQKALACKSPEELLALAKEEGYELSDADLDAVSGGDNWDLKPNCSNHCTHNCVGLAR